MSLAASLAKAVFERCIHHAGFGQAGVGADESVLDLPEVSGSSAQQGRGAQELLGARGDAGQVGVGLDLGERLQQRLGKGLLQELALRLVAPGAAALAKPLDGLERRRPRPGPAARSRRVGGRRGTSRPRRSIGLGIG